MREPISMKGHRGGDSTEDASMQLAVRIGLTKRRYLRTLNLKDSILSLLVLAFNRECIGTNFRREKISPRRSEFRSEDSPGLYGIFFALVNSVGEKLSLPKNRCRRNFGNPENREQKRLEDRLTGLPRSLFELGKGCSEGGGAKNTGGRCRLKLTYIARSFLLASRENRSVLFARVDSPSGMRSRRERGRRRAEGRGGLQQCPSSVLVDPRLKTAANQYFPLSRV